jgi:hypothetical protein
VPAWLLVADEADEKARTLIASWAQAQSDRNLDAYLAHYATDDTARRTKFVGSPVIAIERPATSPGSDHTTVIVDLTERTWRAGFSVHSSKSLVIETAGGTPRITSEVTDWSRPGWDDAEQPSFDASQMTSPISIRIRTAGRDGGDCVTRAAIVELTDAYGVTAEIPIRSDADRATAAHALVPSARKYVWTDACAGIRIERGIWKYRDGLELREEWVDDASRAGHYSHTIADLPPGAEVRMR